MVRERLARYRDRARRKLLEAFREKHTPHQVAASFAIGIFITSLPTGGLGIGLFFVLISLQSWISKPAIFASVAVLNPFVKPAVYVASFQLGGTLLGSSAVDSWDESAGEAAAIAVQQLLLGNLVIAVLLTGVAYATVFHLTRAHRRRSGQQSETSFASLILGLFRRP
ncbi:DUF2062 domain-containing protein [Natronolimnohabitans innermongolicus]|uniref:DUF2062 domain-containing protein n=1 Tax=Natronolimnohabitans innermongolicus JCM 12255 TaxID=1227499 RepID=L9XGF5_9EURY|nr:DUF2062 domain-containing protein [Natronolimnohabitans innermongolicus]ELY60687.1 hypothetical protein C493_04401 [Natronolimnohabitans innermongolicus JCM 12255]